MGNMSEAENNLSIWDACPWLPEWSGQLGEDDSVMQAIDWGELGSIPLSSLTDLQLNSIVKALVPGLLPELRFQEFFPFVPLIFQVIDLELSTRSTNSLLRAGYSSFGDLAPIQVPKIEAIKNLGSQSLQEIFGALLKVNARCAQVARSAGAGSLLAPLVASLDGLERQLLSPEELRKQSPVISALEEIASWRKVSGGTKSFELLALDFDGEDCRQYSTLVSAVEVIESFIADIEAALPPLFSKFSNFDSAAKDLVAKRICSAEKLTLQQLGDLHSLSRERIRQIEGWARGLYRQIYEEDPRVQHLVSELQRNFKVLEYVSYFQEQFPNQSTYENLEGVSDIEIVIGFEHGFFIFDGYVSRLDRNNLTHKILEIARSDELRGLLTEKEFREALGNELGNPGAALEYIMLSGQIDLRGGYVIPPKVGLVDLAAMALAANGQPMAFERLAEIVLGDKAKRSLRNAMFSDSRFVRTSLTEWALSRWNLDAYTNIKDEISRVLDQVGRIQLEELHLLLTSKFGVSASSVSAYAAAWPFQTIGGIVSKADTAKVSFGQPLAAQRDLFNVNGSLLIRLRFGTEQVRGSSTPVSKAAAAFLGVDHGQTKEFDFSKLGTQIIFGYTGLRPTLGSIRDLALASGAKPGDQIFLLLGNESDIHPRPKDHSLTFSDLETFLGKPLKTLPETEIRKALVALLSLSPTETFPGIFSVLRTRNEMQLEAELRNLLGDNEAFGLEISLNSESQFKVSQIEDF